MKKLKLSELGFNDSEVLSREQLKKIRGGELSDPGNPPPSGTCRYHYTEQGLTYVSNCYSQSYAIDQANIAYQDGYTDAGWCCDSCGSHGWGDCSD